MWCIGYVDGVGVGWSGGYGDCFARYSIDQAKTMYRSFVNVPVNH